MINHYGDNFEFLSSILDRPEFSDILQRKNVGIIHWWWLTEEQSKLDNLENFIKDQDVCFFLSEEVFQRNSADINELFKLLNRYNVFYILFSEDYSLTVNPCSERTFRTPWFFKANLHVPASFKPDLDYVEKPYDFNLMLGAKKPFRTLLYKLLKSNKKIYASYLGHPEFKFESNTHLDDSDIAADLLNQEVENTKLHTMNFVNRDNGLYPISHVIPRNIYANTHFDIVAETKPEDNIQFLTEKTAKPLATGRFFCWFGSPSVKAYLNNFGFEMNHYSYGDFWYDEQDHEFDRLDSLISTIELITSDTAHIKKIYDQTRSARLHNMQVYNRIRKNFNTDLCSWISLCLQK